MRRSSIIMRRRSPSNTDRLTLIGKLFIAILLIAVFEGALRKWVSNSLTYPVVALRDGLAGFGICWVLAKTHRCYVSHPFQQLLFASMLLIIWGWLQMMMNQTPPLVFLLGLRFWLLYLWFGVLAAIAMRPHDFKVISQVLVLLVIAMAPLAVMQHFLPPGSFWNKQVDKNSFIFRVAGDIVRTTGTFSFTTGYTIFLAMATPFVFMSLDVRAQLWQVRWMPMLSAVSILAATIVSGSRGAIIFFGVLFMIYALSAIRYARGKKKGQAVAMICLVVALLAASLSIFSRAVDATQARFESAYEVEDPVDRLIYTFVPQGEIPFLGEGIGMGSNFAAILIGGERTFLLAESENARIILEAGILGLAVLIVKLVIIWRAGFKSLRIAKVTGSVSTLLIWATLALALLSWPIVGQLTVNVLGYLLFGLGIAALRLNKTRYLP